MRQSTSEEVAPSFRDPDGVVVHHDDRIFRFVSMAAGHNLLAFLDSELGKSLALEGKLIETTELRRNDLVEMPGLTSRLLREEMPWDLVFEHQKIDFVNYPSEWPPEMLLRAAELTIDLALAVLGSGWSFKDASPSNVMFRGTKPVLVDLLSIESRTPGDCQWLAYAQFVRTFVLPLLQFQVLGIPPHELFLHNREGIEPDVLFGRLSWWQRMHGVALTKVTFPVGLNRFATHGNTYARNRIDSLDKADYVLRTLLGGLKRDLVTLRPRPARSRWTEYTGAQCHYSANELEAKRRFVRECLLECHPRTVLDVGCNSGEFSLMAARLGASVVAIDSDVAAVSQTWRNAVGEEADVLPLVVNLSHPTPAIGWENRESAAFLERANGRFDMVCLLAVLHHLLVTERVPLRKIAGLCWRLTKRWVILEWVPKDDTRFQQILRGRDHLFTHIDLGVLEKVLGEFFAIRRQVKLSERGRSLYLLERRHLSSVASIDQ